MSHLTRRAYVSGPYWSMRDRWQIIHVSDTYDTGKMKIKCNLYVTTRNSPFMISASYFQRASERQPPFLLLWVHDIGSDKGVLCREIAHLSSRLKIW